MTLTCGTCAYLEEREPRPGYGICVYYPHFKRKKRTEDKACREHQPDISQYLSSPRELAVSDTSTGDPENDNSRRNESGGLGHET